MQSENARSYRPHEPKLVTALLAAQHTDTQKLTDRLLQNRRVLHQSREIVEQISGNFDFKKYAIDAGSGSRIRPAAGPILQSSPSA